MQYFSKTNINFISARKPLFIFTIALSIMSIVAFFVVKPQYGIDFEGGTEVAIEFARPVDAAQVRSVVENTKLRGAEIKSYGSPGQFLIRATETGDAADIIKESFLSAFPDNPTKTLKVDRIGPKIGEELKTNAFWAVLLSIIMILIYLAFRFEFIFGLGAVVALAHDVIVTFALIIILNKTGLFDLEVNQTIIAAILTVVGYSMNDTVIIFDRIRENREANKTEAWVPLVNRSINETLSRTVNTVGTVVIVLIVLSVFGGPVLQGFAITMLIGVLFGTYSSVYVASSFVIWYLQHVKKVEVGKVLKAE